MYEQIEDIDEDLAELESIVLKIIDDDDDCIEEMSHRKENFHLFGHAWRW